MPSPSSFRKGFNLFPGDKLATFTARDGRQVWRVVDSHAGHDVVKQYERYDFPIRATLLCEGAGVEANTITAVPDTDTRLVSPGRGHAKVKGKKRARAASEHPGADNKPALSLEAAFASTLGESLIVYSDYGSPYECTIGQVKVVPVDAIEVRPEAGANGQPCVALTCHGVARRRRDLSRQGDDVADAKHVERTTLSDDEKDMLAKSYRIMRSFLSSGSCKACSDAFVAKQWIAKRRGETTRGGWIHARCALRLEGATAPSEPGTATSKARAKQAKVSAGHSRRATRTPKTGDIGSSPDDVAVPARCASKKSVGSSPSRAGTKRARRASA